MLRGPPHIALRVLVAPVLLVSTVALFGTGVALLALGRGAGTIVGLHQASFIVWVAAASLHVLAHLSGLLRALRDRVPGLGFRVALAGSSLVLGLTVATLTLPAADSLQDSATSHAGFDSR